MWQSEEVLQETAAGKAILFAMSDRNSYLGEMPQNWECVVPTRLMSFVIFSSLILSLWCPGPSPCPSRRVHICTGFPVCSGMQGRVGNQNPHLCLRTARVSSWLIFPTPLSQAPCNPSSPLWFLLNCVSLHFVFLNFSQRLPFFLAPSQGLSFLMRAVQKNTPHALQGCWGNPLRNLFLTVLEQLRFQKTNPCQPSKSL